MMAGNEFPGKNGRGHAGKARIWRRGDAVFHSNTRPSLSPTKRKLPGAAPAETPAAPESPENKVAAAGQGWEAPIAGPTPKVESQPADEPSGDVPDAPLYIKEEPEDLAAAQKRRRVRILISALIPVFAIVLVVSLWQIFSIQKEYTEAVTEYEQIKQQAFAARPSSLPAASGQEAAEEALVFDLATVQAMNPDCVGWIEIPGTSLSYPLVRAGDNDKYLNHTFLGSQNSAGTIFMDYRNPTNLQGQHLVLYGHNMKNGSMFGLLPKYLDNGYLQSNATLLLMDGGQVYTYRIFSARTTDAYDPAYQIDFASAEAFSAFAEAYGAPAGTTQMLTMSTCTNVNDDERILVHAYLVGVAPA